MNLSDFDYEYPKELVAQRPLGERDASRMMILDRAGRSWRHATARELPGLLKPGDLLVLNDTRVVPARLFAMRGRGERVEVLIVEPAVPQRGDSSKSVWRCLLKKAKRIRAGEQFFFGMHATAKALGRDGIFLLLEFDPRNLELAIEHHGVPPLPPYIERDGYEAYTAEDRERYQTVYAKVPGSAAAPTAGLHLSEKLLAELAAAGVEIAHITLHVGIDTFAPVRADRVGDHRMHGERYAVGPEAAGAIAAARQEGRRVIAAGTTTVRALESAAEGPLEGTTRLFITPGYRFRAIDALLTNFHQPRSTLLMMVAAFAGREFILAAYEEAIRERYRLFSYGDCMLIL